MNAKDRPLSSTERALADRLERLVSPALPIADPLLADVSEMLHRICMTQSLSVAQWIAGDAIGVLRKYVEHAHENRS